MFTVIIFLGFGLQPANADDASGISIQNIKVQPSMVKVGDTFTVTATLVNNSPSTIYVEAGGCAGPFSVIFANHTRINHTYEGCTLMEIIHKLDPGEKAIETSSGSNDVYMATSAGTVNATVTFSYFVKSQSDDNPQRIEKTVSKSFSFAIYDNNAEIQLNDAIMIPFKDSELVAVGKIITANSTASENKTEYTVAVEKYLKNPKPYDLLTAIGYGIRKEITDPSQQNYFNQPVFEKGDRVFLYLTQNGGKYAISPFSFLISRDNMGLPPGTAIIMRPDKNSYYGNENMSILGVINKGHMYTSEAEYGKNSTVSIVVTNPNNEKYLTDQVDIKPDGNFIYQFKIKGKLGVSGTYGSLIDVGGGGSGITFDYVTDPLNQFKSGIKASDTKCQVRLQLIFKAEDGSPACVKPQTAQKLVEHGWGWAMQAINSIKPLRPNRIIGLENDTGVVTFGNQTYYFDTPNYTETAYVSHVQVSFHDVVFTLFPSGFRGGLPDNQCGEQYYWTDTKFSDGTSELLHIYPITSMSQECLALPEPTHFSTHRNPQAGLTFYDGKMKLLVSMEEATRDTTYLSQTVDEWKNKTPGQLDAYYKKYKDIFYTELGSFLIKNEMKKELERQRIQNMHDDFKVFPGVSLDSLPPHISYDAVVNATDGNSYLLLGDVFANKIESLKITKLVFDKDLLNSLSTGKRPSYTNQFEKAPKVMISERSGTNPIVEPYNLALELDKNNLVTFYNNLTVPIRIQPYGSGLTVDEGGLGWKSKVIGPDEMVAIQFNKTGYYEWNARSPPQGSENGWDFHASGQIVAFSQYHDNSTPRDRPKMAQVFVTDTDIPWSSTGLGKYGVLEIRLYESIYHMIPDAQKYYAARAMQLIPFYVPVIITSPSFTEK